MYSLKAKFHTSTPSIYWFLHKYTNFLCAQKNTPTTYFTHFNTQKSEPSIHFTTSRNRIWITKFSVQCRLLFRLVLSNMHVYTRVFVLEFSLDWMCLVLNVATSINYNSIVSSVSPWPQDLISEGFLTA